MISQPDSNKMSPKVINFNDYPSNLKANKVEWLTSRAERQSLRGLQAEIVILSFWAQWCAPCVIELPIIERAAQQLKDFHIKFVLINTDEPENLKKAESLMNNLNIKSSSIVYNSSLSKDLNIGILPAHIVFNKNAQAIAEIYGAVDWTHPKVIRQLKDLANRSSADSQ